MSENHTAEDNLIEGKRCLYCDQRKPVGEFSREHIWPDALGGGFLPPELFQTDDVCRRCNNLCGLFVDGAFIKSWFVQNDLSSSAHDYLDPERPSIAPLGYLGEMPIFPVGGNEVCERWLGLAGEHVYHIHERDEPRWDAYAGGDIIGRKRKSQSRAYLALTSEEEYWYLTALLTFNAYFPKAKRCVLNAGVSPDHPYREQLACLLPQPDPVDLVQSEEVNFIRMRGGQEVHIEVVSGADHDSRFLCKVVLGLSHQLLGPRFGETPYAVELRRGLRIQRFEDRRPARVRGKGMFASDENRDLGRVIGCPGAWTLTIRQAGDALALVVVSPGGHLRTVAISDEPPLWADGRVDVDAGGSSFVVIPQRKQAWGPMPEADLVAWNLAGRRSGAIEEIASMRVALADLPPKQPNR